MRASVKVGYTVLMNIEGQKIDFSSMPKGFKTPKMINLKRISARKTQMIMSEVVEI